MTLKTFIFDAYRFDPDSNQLILSYAYDDGPRFDEVFTFPHTTMAQADALDAVFRLLFFLCGVSYYKAYAPEHIIFNNNLQPDEATAALMRDVYTKGLAEFAYENDIDIRGRVHIDGQGGNTPAPALHLPQRALVPVGGGKDSIVTIEALQNTGHKVTLFALGGPSGAAGPIADTIRTSGLDHIYVSRIIAPELIALNKEADVMNGHIPITAIVSATALVCAVMYGHNAVILSNEHSASAPNLTQGDWEVNHQYSKSFSFETMLADYVRSHIAADLNYFSLLRPLTEAAIAKRFASATAYHSVFRSCNTAFHQDVSKRGTKWCCDCPKCRFVFLALAPFMNKGDLTYIFGENMLANENQIHGFRQLCGQVNFKPFECVGDISESALLMEQLSRMDAWKEDSIVKACTHARGDFNDAYAALFELSDDHAVPEDYRDALG